jgi:hypothetical protein
MHFRSIALAGAALLLCGCQQATDETKAANAVGNAAAAVKHPTYCFFKDAAAKGWAASKDKSGNVVVKGKAHLDDAAYRGALVDGESKGEKATIWLNMAPNATGHASPDGWWDVSATVPDSAAATNVTVMCGTKTVAQLKVGR